MSVAYRVIGGERPTQTDFEMCRTIGHAWDDYNAEQERPLAGWRFSLRCTRCTCERHDVISRLTGSILGRRYLWPEGYRLERGSERPTRPELRNRIFERLRKDLVANNAVAAVAARKNGVEDV